MSDLIERLRGWDRCYPGNDNIEDMIDCAAAEIARLTRERDEARAALVEVEGCFEAADREGFAYRLDEMQDRAPGSLHDLLVRRVLFAREAAICALSTGGGDAT